MIVRKMIPLEFDPTIILVSRYFSEAAESIQGMSDEYDENSVIDTVKKFATHYEYSWFNLYDNSRPVGFIAGYITACPWNKDKIIANIAFLYIMESHRNIDNLKKLVNEFESWARLLKAKQITGGDIGINVDRMEKLYEHFGFSKALMMTKEIDQ